jgi:hypothetical protein
MTRLPSRIDPQPKRRAAQGLGLLEFALTVIVVGVGLWLALDRLSTLRTLAGDADRLLSASQQRALAAWQARCPPLLVPNSASAVRPDGSASSISPCPVNRPKNGVSP